MTVAIAPGPASIGTAIGTIATSSFSDDSACSSGVERVREGCARIMSTAMRSSMIPPAILNAPREIPNILKMRPPASENTDRKKNANTAARRAISFFLATGSSDVIARKIGTAANGSTTNSTAVNATAANLRSAPIALGRRVIA